MPESESDISGSISRRNLLAAASSAGLGVLGLTGAAAQAQATTPANKVYKIGVISATNRGKSQNYNGHTWHFAQYLHPECNLDMIKKHLDPGSIEMFHKIVRNPRENFDQLPFPDTRITQYYDINPVHVQAFCETFPGVQPAKSVEDMVKEVDAIWLGDASGFGDDHYDLVAPGLEKGLPTFCDKPIGDTVAGVRKVLQFAEAKKTPIMSSSLFRHLWGTEQAVRLKQTKEYGELQFVLASLMAGFSEPGWMVYGQHPAWTIMTLCGPGVEAVSAYARPNVCHALVTYPDRNPAEIWYGRPDVQYSSNLVAFDKKTYQYSSDIEGNWWLGHHYSMFRMANTFRKMIQTRVEPIPHQEILEVSAIVHAGMKSLKEKGRYVPIAEVMS